MNRDVYIIDETEELITSLKNIFKFKRSFKFKNINIDELEEELKNIPCLIIVNEDTINLDAATLCKTIRKDEDNTITPIIVISSNEDDDHKVSVIKNQVEYYLSKPINEQVLGYTIENISRLLHVNRGASPLTGLPRKPSDTRGTEKKDYKARRL